MVGQIWPVGLDFDTCALNGVLKTTALVLNCLTHYLDFWKKALDYVLNESTVHVDILNVHGGRNKICISLQSLKNVSLWKVQHTTDLFCS